MSRFVRSLGALAGSLAVAGCGTSTPPKPAAATSPPDPPVELHLNQGDFSQTASRATLTGTVARGAILTVDGGNPAIHGRAWQRTVRLKIGTNAVTVVASLVGHRSVEHTVTIVRRHTHAELAALQQAAREREARRKASEEQEAQKRREARAVEQHEEHEHKEIEDATPSQQNALRAAENYLQTSAFSEAGLIEQLSSEAGDKYPREDAIFAVAHLHVDWNEQAVKAAKQYLSTSSFSCQGMIEQLSSEAGDKYTVPQAEHGAKEVGLC